jgi:hypothetical protein
MGWQCHQHVGDMSARQSNVGTFGQHGPVGRANTKLIATQHFRVRDGRHLPLSSFCTRVRDAQPAKNLYIRSLVFNTMEQLTTTTHNNQHEPRRPTLHLGPFYRSCTLY